jgi:hypothetical protein
MVFYFKSTIVDPPAYVYVGKDKFESAWLSYSPLHFFVFILTWWSLGTDEELIAHGWEEDVW